MRENKYRHWCDNEETCDFGMHYDTPYKIIRDGGWINLKYIGKDKNNNDMYESDILRCKYLEKEINVIEWYGNGFWIQESNGGLCLPNKENMEIIGNIYENKELLNENKT